MAEMRTPPTLDARVAEAGLRLHRRLASSGLYLAALVVFLLPFASVSCGSQTVLTLSGLDLTFGRDLGTQFGTAATLGINAGHLDAHPWLLLALLAPIAGLVVALVHTQTAVPDRVVAIVLTSAGAIGLLMMLILLGDIGAVNSAIQSGVNCQGQSGCVNLGAAAVQVGPAGGLWIEALLNAGMAALGIVWLNRWKPATEPPTPAPAAQPTEPAPPG
jgi:hypothetical protein